MNEADNKRVYDVYKMLYDALCTVELTMDYYKNPETGDFYRDENGDATYSEFLKHQDNALYAVISIVQSYEDDVSRNQYIANLIDSIVYALEEFIDTDEFSGLFSNLPVMSAEAVKQYVATVINFYKSYKVDFLGMNTVYTIEDDGDGKIRLIDDIEIYRYLEKVDKAKIKEYIAKLSVDMSPQERLEMIDRIYLDIKTLVILNMKDTIEIRDEIYEIIIRLMLYSIVKISERIVGIKTDFSISDSIFVSSICNILFVNASFLKYIYSEV